MLTIAPLAPVPPQAVEALLDAAFGADRRGRTAYRLREGAAAIPALSFAAHRDGALVGTLQSWPVALLTPEGARHDLVMVGPVAVAPHAQNSGVGRAMMAALVSAAARTAAPALMMIGDPDYYAAWDFTAAATGGWRIDGPYEQHRLLARAAGALPRAGLLVPARAAALV